MGFHRKHKPVGRLRQARHARGLTQEQLADLAGVDQGTISSLERSPHRMPLWPTAKALSKALGVTPEELFPAPPLSREAGA